MIVLTLDPYDPDPATLSQAADMLAAGGLIAFPTDTVYGLAADPRSEAAVARVYGAKGRDRGVAIPLIAGSLEQAFAAGRLGAREQRLAQAFWPGPLSLIVPATPAVVVSLRGAGDTIAVRVPDHAVARGLALALGFPITATSANLSGEPAAASPPEISAALAARLDAVIDAGPAPGGPPSTIVALPPEGPRLIRAGAIAWERVLTFLE
jgi:L-threonylcarbamoyladenylate synthase